MPIFFIAAAAGLVLVGLLLRLAACRSSRDNVRDGPSDRRGWRRPRPRAAGIGSMPLLAAAKMITTASSAPPRAPAMIVRQITHRFAILLRCGGLRAPRPTMSLARSQSAVPCGRSRRARVANMDRLLHGAGSIIGFGGGKIGHRLILQVAVGLGGFIPGKDVVIFRQDGGFQIVPAPPGDMAGLSVASCATASPSRNCGAWGLQIHRLLIGGNGQIAAWPWRDRSAPALRRNRDCWARPGSGCWFRPAPWSVAAGADRPWRGHSAPARRYC